MLDEFQLKIDRIRRLLSSIGHEAILLSSQTSFSWLTAARGHIGLASEGACAKILVTNEETVFITNSIEANRLREEELEGLPCKIISFDWFDPDGEKNVINSLVEHVIDEKDVLVELADIRYPLLESEQGRYEQLGREVGQIIEDTSRNLQIGNTEFEIAAQLAKSCISLGIDPVTNLIATDERIWKYRHPLPTGKKMERYALLAIGGRRHGLTASATRLVHFGNLSDELKEKHRAVTEVDATFISESQPGVNVGEIFKKISSCYKKYGYENEWHHHHQGGLTGYVPREYRVTPNSKQNIGENQAFAWNPSISGVKSEDTILVKKNETKILTRTGEFPEIDIEISGRKISRPEVLIRNNYY